MDYDTFNYWLESTVQRFYSQHCNALRDQLTIFMSTRDYSKFLRMLQENLPLYLQFEISAQSDMYGQCKYRGITVKPCASINDNEYKIYV